MYSENCDDCGLNGITDTVKTLFSTGTEIVSDVAKDLPALYQQKKEQEAKEASLQKQYTNNLAKIRAETEARRKELEALEARKATAAAQAAGVKSPATGAMTAAWFKENAVLISLGIALIGLALRVKGK